MKPVILLAVGATMLGLGVVAASAPPARAASGQELELTIPFNAVSYNITPFWAAVDHGLFGRYGVKVTNAGQMESPALVSSMLSGESPFGIISPEAGINADLNGGDIVVLVAGPRLYYALNGPLSAHRIIDLKSKTIAITQLGTSTDFLTRYLLTKGGLHPGEDVTLLPMGNGATEYAALLTDRVDGEVLMASEAVEAAQLHRFSVLVDSYHSDLMIYCCSLVAKKSWVAAHRNDTLNVVRGFIAGDAMVFTDKAAAIAAESKYLGINDSYLLENFYEDLLKGLSKVPLVNPAALQMLLDESKLPAAKQAKPESFIDSSFVQELQQDGFIADLYK
jgi:ABC-type nitrate/sulfonate/bicarbonate transport system substrate-binding protein